MGVEIRGMGLAGQSCVVRRKVPRGSLQGLCMIPEQDVNKNLRSLETNMERWECRMCMPGSSLGSE
jgi:hypothetical protein